MLILYARIQCLDAPGKQLKANKLCKVHNSSLVRLPDHYQS